MFSGVLHVFRLHDTDRGPSRVVRRTGNELREIRKGQGQEPADDAAAPDAVTRWTAAAAAVAFVAVGRDFGTAGKRDGADRDRGGPKGRRLPR